jgi:hypothetical protein
LEGWLNDSSQFEKLEKLETGKTDVNTNSGGNVVSTIELDPFGATPAATVTMLFNRKSSPATTGTTKLGQRIKSWCQACDSAIPRG